MEIENKNIQQNSSQCCQGQSDNDTEKHDNRLQECLQEVTRLKDAYVRISADFENARKRMEKERQQWLWQMEKDILVGLLPIVDNFERALAQKEKNELDALLQPWFDGFVMIYKELNQYLEKMGVKQVATDRFDPEFHEAIAAVESDKNSGDIVQVFEKGYILQDKVLRPAKVSVAK